MVPRRLDSAGLDALASAVADAGVVARWRSKVVVVTESECVWWTGAISGRGHGRFYYAPGRVVIAHGFGFGAVHGVEVLDQVPVLGHRCDNPLCQRVHPERVVASSYEANRLSGPFVVTALVRLWAIGERDGFLAWVADIACFDAGDRFSSNTCGEPGGSDRFLVEGVGLRRS